jgi:hypothetical protein
MSGYTPADAQIIARGSQSLDDNATTTAFADVVVDASRLHRELHEVATLDRAPDEITHMLPSQVFHGLTSDDNRATVEQMHIERLRRYHAQGGGSPDARRRTELVYLGEYLHLVADEVVHPHDPMIGHFAEGHSPDRAETNPAKLLNAITLIREKLDEYGGAGGHAGNPRGLQVTTSERIHETPEKLAPDPLLAAHFQILADTVVASSQLSAPAPVAARERRRRGRRSSRRTRHACCTTISVSNTASTSMGTAARGWAASSSTGTAIC